MDRPNGDGRNGNGGGRRRGGGTRRDATIDPTALDGRFSRVDGPGGRGDATRNRGGASADSKSMATAQTLLGLMRGSGTF